MEKPWLQNYPKEIPHTISNDMQPLHVYLQQMSSRYPEKKALHFLGKDITFAVLDRKVRQFANYLKRLGVKKVTELRLCYQIVRKL